jgi:hypothetical protein
MTVAAVLLALIVLPLADVWFQIAPPWPETQEQFLGAFHWPVILGTMAVPLVVSPCVFIRTRARPPRMRGVVTTLVALSLSGCAYLVSYSLLVYEDPTDRAYRKVKGWKYSDDERVQHAIGKGDTSDALLHQFGDVYRVYTAFSVATARALLLILWYATAGQASLVAALVLRATQVQPGVSTSPRAKRHWLPGEFAQLAALVDRDCPELEPMLVTARKALGSSFEATIATEHATGFRSVAEAVYNAALAASLQYEFEPATPGAKRQEVRLAREVLAGGYGTCLDLALLYAALLERAHVVPAVIFVKKETAWHALGGFFDGPFEPAAPGVLEDVAAIRKMVEAGSLIAVESTGLAAARGKKKKYSQACAEGKAAVENNVPLAAVNILRSRRDGVKPPE